MWLIPFSPGEDHIVTIHFTKVESLAGLRIWNYNKSPEDTYRGVSWQLAKAFCLAGEMAGLALWPGVEPSGGGGVSEQLPTPQQNKAFHSAAPSSERESGWLAGRGVGRQAEVSVASAKKRASTPGALRARPGTVFPGQGGPCVPGQQLHLPTRRLPHPQRAWQLSL